MFLVGPLIYLIFLICFIFCVFLGYYIGKKKRSSLWGWGAFLISFGAIFGNEVYVNLLWNNMCNSGGFHVYKKVNVDGFFFKDKTLLSLRDSSAKVYLRLGYKYIEAQGEEPEGRHRNVQLYRYSMSHKGEITRNVVSDLNSDYAVGFVDPFPVSDYINERRYEVRNRATGELLGMSNRFDTRGGWLMNWLLDTLLSNNIAGTVSVCPETYPDVIPLVIPPIGFSGVEK